MDRQQQQINYHKQCKEWQGRLDGEMKQAVFKAQATVIRNRLRTASPWHWTYVRELSDLDMLQYLAGLTMCGGERELDFLIQTAYDIHKAQISTTEPQRA